MGKNAKILSALLTFLFAVVFAFAQYDSSADTPGKPCKSSFHCWRSEPVNIYGEPMALERARAKRLEIGSNGGKGGRCRCVDGACSLFQQTTSSFIPCEEF